jgi:hypothetical protein
MKQFKQVRIKPRNVVTAALYGNHKFVERVDSNLNKNRLREDYAQQEIDDYFEDDSDD